MEENDLSVVEAAPLRYLQSIPSGDRLQEGAWPVLCFLHGYDEAAPTEIHRALTRHGPLRSGSSPRAIREFIIVAAQLPRAGDIWHAYADAVREIVAEVQQAHRGDPQQTYLSGFSFGGNGVFDLAAAQADFWAALWPVDPTRVPERDPGRPVWLSFGQVARRGKEQFNRALDLQPIGTVPEGDRLYLDEGQDHVGSAACAYADDRIYDWLLSKRLP